ncbi:hypothetical protein Tco_0856735 [Tanacetum coccineum]|uniref:Uncharacterized protein n=1 Tax=Tanacetum coccineum TaxID=301880 RepID=A0ABQ5B834_9ASTR
MEYFDLRNLWVMGLPCFCCATLTTNSAIIPFLPQALQVTTLLVVVSSSRLCSSWSDDLSVQDSTLYSAGSYDIAMLMAPPKFEASSITFPSITSRVPVANVTLSSSAHLLRENTDSSFNRSRCSYRFTTLAIEQLVPFSAEELPSLIIEEEDGEQIRFLGGNSSSGTKKYLGSNSNDGGNTGDGFKIAGGIIRAGDEIECRSKEEHPEPGFELQGAKMVEWSFHGIILPYPSILSRAFKSSKLCLINLLDILCSNGADNV